MKKFFLALVVIGVLARFYGINDPWKKADHYNFGGVHITVYAECLKKTPLRISRGVPHGLCWTDHPSYYPNHPPTILFALWPWTDLFGFAEWSIRLFIALFSIANVFLVYLISKEVRGENFPLIAAALQSCFLGNIYFGTHPDFICEFTTTFLLLTAWLAIKLRFNSAVVVGWFASLTAWPAFFIFPVLFAYTWLSKQGRKRVAVAAVISLACSLAMMMWLNGSTNIFEFLVNRVMHPGYGEEEQLGLAALVVIPKIFISSLSRLLSPALATIACFSLVLNRSKADTKIFSAAWLAGGSGLIYAIIGYKAVIHHIFLLLLLTPGLAIIAADLIDKGFDEKNIVVKKSKKTIFVLALLFLTLYPYGIYKSSVILDIAASFCLVSSGLLVLIFSWKERWNQKTLRLVIAVAVLGNILQMMNYRNEPDTERSFCQEAKAEFLQTGQPIETNLPDSYAKSWLYCRDLPVHYQ